MTKRWKPSVTVAAIACRVHEGETQYLLVEERTPQGLQLNNPAGHLERGESPEQGVVREALEETARIFVPEAFVGVYLSRTRRVETGAEASEGTTYVRLAFCGQVSEPDPALLLDHGIVRTLWMGLPELRASRHRHRSPLVLRCIEDHAAGRRLPLSLVTTDVSVWNDADSKDAAQNR